MDKGMHTLLHGKLLNLWRRKMSHEKISKVTQVGSEYLSTYSVKNQDDAVNDLLYRTEDRAHEISMIHCLYKTWDLKTENY